jgi:hypothetical protein
MRMRPVDAVLASLLLTTTAAFADPAAGTNLGEIERTLEEQERTIRALQERVEELEGTGAAQKAPLPPVSAPETPPEEPAGKGVLKKALESEEPLSPPEMAEAEIRAGRRDPVIYRGALNDRQVAAARAGDYTIDPDYRGFIPVPNTVALIKFNARPRVDFGGDTGEPGARYRFVPSQFPPSNQNGWRFAASANGSQLRTEVVAPSLPGNFRFFYQNDFFGSDDRPMRYRLQHLYGTYFGIVAGFTFGVFEDPDAWPDTIDYEGPNSVVFARRALGQYQRQLGDDWDLTLSIEDPDLFVDTTTDPGGGASQRSRAPDAGFAVRWTPGDLGHVRASAIFRSIGVDGDTFSNDDVFGWGINTSGSIHVLESTTAQWWFVYGEGIGGMGNDTSFLNSDAAYDLSGKLVPLEYWSTMVALTHHWTPRLRSTATHGYVRLDSTNAQPGTTYRSSHYASLNLVYQLFKRLSLGVEGLYGIKNTKGGQDNDVFRIQAGISLALFD